MLHHIRGISQHRAHLGIELLVDIVGRDYHHPLRAVEHTAHLLQLAVLRWRHLEDVTAHALREVCQRRHNRDILALQSRSHRDEFILVDWSNNQVAPFECSRRDNLRYTIVVVLGVVEREVDRMTHHTHAIQADKKTSVEVEIVLRRLLLRAEWQQECHLCPILRLQGAEERLCVERRCNRRLFCRRLLHQFRTLRLGGSRC